MLVPDIKENDFITQQKLENLLIWIDEHIQDPIGWTELVAHIGFDHRTIQNLFFKYKAMRPINWIRKRREELRSYSAPTIHPMIFNAMLTD
ncbi:MAG: hypothetical protein ACKVOY_02405 [Burkholderiaceae bacterium]